MSYATKPLNINTLDNSMAGIPKNILNAIHHASQKGDVDFSYLLQQAKAESNFNPNAKARTSSATGLYQFIDSTWLRMVERYGDAYGIDTAGHSRQEILNMRKDPQTASFMAAAFASENERFLTTQWGGDIGATELYLAHFLGAHGAASFLNARDENPMRPAADLHPRAAQANRSVFYDSETGRARSLAEVYDFFDKKFTDDTDTPPMQVANAPIPPALPERRSIQRDITTQPHFLSDNIIMQRAQAMRNRWNTQDGINPPLHPKSPFFSLIAKPVDVMLMVQTSTPAKVVRDNG